MTKIVPNLSDLMYKEGLNKLELPSLQERRVRADMIAAFNPVKETDKIDRDYLLIRGRGTDGGHQLPPILKKSGVGASPNV